MLGRGEFKRILVSQDLLAAFVNHLLGKGSTGDGTLYCRDFIVDVLGHEQNVVASQQRVDTSRSIEHLGSPLHVQRIGEDQAIKAHVATQERVYAFRRKACGCLTPLDGRHQQMGSENATQSCLDKLAERHQFASVDFLQGLVDDRQGLVRVLTRRPMAREMLSHSHHTAILQSSGKRDGMPGHQFRTLAKRAVANHRVQRVIVHVEYRGEIHLNAHAAALACHLTTVIVEQHIVVQSTQYEVALEIRHFLQPHAQSPLAIDGNHQRHRRQRLRQVSHSGLIGDRAVFIDETSHQITSDQATHQLTGSVVARRRHGSDDELPDSRLGRQRVENAVHPSIHRYLVHLIKQVGQACGLTPCGTHRERHSHSSQQYTFEFGHFSLNYFLEGSLGLHVNYFFLILTSSLASIFLPLA